MEMSNRELIELDDIQERLLTAVRDLGIFVDTPGLIEAHPDKMLSEHITALNKQTHDALGAIRSCVGNLLYKGQ